MHIPFVSKLFPYGSNNVFVIENLNKYLFEI